MQNNQNFLEKMQGLLSINTNPVCDISNNNDSMNNEEMYDADN